MGNAHGIVSVPWLFQVPLKGGGSAALSFNAPFYAAFFPLLSLQGSVKRQSPGLVNFVTALAYYSCLALPAAFTQPWATF